MIAEYSNQLTAARGLNFITADHLGSVRVVTDPNWNLRSRHDYLPFGEEIAANYGARNSVGGYGATDGLNQRFTGKERDLESVLDYFGARYYSSSQGRFLGADPWRLIQRIGDPQSWNAYSYVRNGPLTFVDRDGRSFEQFIADIDNYTGWGRAIDDNPIYNYAVEHPVQGGIGVATVSAAGLWAAPESLAEVSMRRLAFGLGGGWLSQYLSDVASNVMGGKTGRQAFQIRSSSLQYSISAISTGATSLWFPKATPIAIGSIGVVTSFAQDRAGQQPITVSGLVMNVVNGVFNGVTQGFIAATPGVSGRLPEANSVADFIGPHASTDFLTQTVSAAAQYITSLVTSVLGKVF